MIDGDHDGHYTAVALMHRMKVTCRLHASSWLGPRLMICANLRSIAGTLVQPRTPRGLHQSFQQYVPGMYVADYWYH